MYKLYKATLNLYGIMLWFFKWSHNTYSYATQKYTNTNSVKILKNLTFQQDMHIRNLLEKTV